VFAQFGDDAARLDALAALKDRSLVERDARHSCNRPTYLEGGS
jgi:hypothetical protein